MSAFTSEHRTRRPWGLKGFNGIGNGCTTFGYIKGAFSSLLYPALVRRMRVLSELLVVLY